jgi:hypothetical protein
MHVTCHFVEWQGERYTIQQLKSVSRVTSLSPVWAVFHRGEFIGTLAYQSNEASEALEGRCISWLRDLLGTRARTFRKIDPYA